MACLSSPQYLPVAAGGAAPLIRGVGSQVTGGAGTSLIITPDVVAQAGDLIIVVINRDIPSEAITWGTFTQQDALNISTGGDGGSIYWAIKTAGGSEPASYTFSWTTGVSGCAVLASYSGVNGTPLDVTSTTNISNSTSPYSVLATGLATGTANRKLVWIGGVDNLSAGTVTSAPPAAAPAAWTERLDVNDSGFVNLALCDCTDAAGNHTSNVTAVQTNSAGGGAGWAGILLAIRPA